MIKYKLLFLLLLLTSCFSDKGNYEYSDIDDISIEGITDQIMYERISFYDTLKIHPVIRRKSGKELPNLDYEWKLVPIGLNDKPEGKDFVIGTEKDLKYLVTELTGKYYGIYRVENRDNGAVYSRNFFVNIRTLTSSGLAILCEENNLARLDWIFRNDETTDLVMKDLWAATPETAELMGKPISLNYFDNVTGNAELRLRLVNCEKGSFCLDPTQQGGEHTNIKYRFATSKDQIDIRGGFGMVHSASPKYIPIIDKNGDVYIKGQLSSAIFAYPSNKVYGETDFFKAAPFVAPGAIKGSGSLTDPSTIFYDQTNCRFVNVRNSWNAIASFNIPTFTGSLFVATTNREMVFMETTSSQNSYAILRDKTSGKYYIYGFKIGSAGANTQRYYVELKGDNLDNVSSYCFNNVHDLLFYASGNKVYQFNLSTGAPAEAIITLNGETIIKATQYKSTVFGVVIPTWMMDYQNKLTVASNSNSTGEGNIRIYNITSTIEAPTLYRDLSGKGLGKIIDICYFE